MAARLYRSRTDRMLGGVCGGLGQYLGIDSTLIRIFFALLAIAKGVSALAYLVLWLIVPPEDVAEGTTTEQTIRSSADEIAERARALGDEVREIARGPHAQAGTIAGAGLIVVGAVLLLQGLQLSWLWWFDLDVLWPLLVVLAGVLVLLRRPRGD